MLTSVYRDAICLPKPQMTFIKIRHLKGTVWFDTPCSGVISLSLLVKKTMFYVFCFFGRKNEVFIYQWYIPSASLEVAPWRSAATGQICFSFQQKYFIYLNKNAWYIVMFWSNRICLSVPDQTQPDSTMSEVNETILEIVTGLLQYWKSYIIACL